jgi:capsular polysaccharide biosynthesis protein
MEIKDYLHVIRRRLWMIVAVPVIAAVAAFLVLGQGPPKFKSSVEVAVPTLAENTAAGAVAVYVADFKEYLTTDPVINQVAQQNPLVPRKSIKKGLSASEVGNSDLLTVSYTGKHKNLVEAVARSAAAATLNETSEPELVDAQAAQQLAEQQYKQAQATLDNFVNTQTGGIPEDQYRERLASLDALKLAASQARLDLDIPKANGLDAQIPLAEASIASLLPQVLTYENLSEAEQQASLAVSSAVSRVQDAQSQVVAHGALVTLRNESPVKSSKLAKDGTIVAVGAGLGLIAVAIYIVFSELVLAGRTRREAESLDRQDITGPDGSGTNGQMGDHLAGRGADPVPAE